MEGAIFGARLCTVAPRQGLPLQDLKFVQFSNRCSLVGFVFSKEGHGEGDILRNSEGEPFMDCYTKDSASRVVMKRAAASDRTSTAFPCTWTTHVQAECLPRSLETDATKEPASVPFERNGFPRQSSPCSQRFNCHRYDAFVFAFMGVD